MSIHCLSTSHAVSKWAALLAVAASFVAAPAGAGAQDLSASQVEAARAGRGETDEMRLARIGYRLAKANSDRCAKPEMLTGLMLHDIAAYGRADRPAITKSYGLGKGFGVLNLVPASSAEHAGIRRGDEILSVNGYALDDFASGLIGKQASYDRTEKFVDFLDRTLRLGPAVLAIRRGGEQLSIQLAGEPGCGGRFVVLPGRSLNAWADGRYVAVTSRMMEFARADEELAFVVAHEMAHNILNHAGQLNGTSRVLALFGFGSGKVKRTEIEADAFAVELMSRTRFDLSAPERFLRHSSKGRWFDLSLTHPTASRRIEIVNTVIAGIEADRLRDRTPATLAKLMAASALDGSAANMGDTAELWARAGWETIVPQLTGADRPSLAARDKGGTDIPPVMAVQSAAADDLSRITSGMASYRDWRRKSPQAVPVSTLMRAGAGDLALLKIEDLGVALPQPQSCDVPTPQSGGMAACAAWPRSMEKENKMGLGAKPADTASSIKLDYGLAGLPPPPPELAKAPAPPPAASRPSSGNPKNLLFFLTFGFAGPSVESLAPASDVCGVASPPAGSV